MASSGRQGPELKIRCALVVFGGSFVVDCDAQSSWRAGNWFRGVDDMESVLPRPGSRTELYQILHRKGGLEFFRYVEDGRMAYAGSVRDDTKQILGREPFLLKEWAKIHANELLQVAGG